MLTPDPVLIRQIPVIQKIVADETWLEGERRGCFVSPNDCVVRERVCEVVLRIGQQLRESLGGQPGQQVQPGQGGVSSNSSTDAKPEGEPPASVTKVGE